LGRDSNDGYAKFGSEWLERPRDPEQMLWAHVVYRAILDAHEWHPVRYRRRTEETIYWLLFDEHDFYTVCSLAGIEPSIVRNHARNVLESLYRAEIRPGDKKDTIAFIPKSKKENLDA
tara:strand:+ start:125 stop:478 length:354 start_codon:yes stop_codon:yes gene_type:complete